MDSPFENVVAGLIVMAVMVFMLIGIYHVAVRPVERAMCTVHAEYTKTEADSAAIVRRIPYCAELFYTK